MDASASFSSLTEGLSPWQCYQDVWELSSLNRPAIPLERAASFLHHDLLAECKDGAKSVSYEQHT